MFDFLQSRRRALLAATALFASIAVLPTQAVSSGFPDKPLRIVVPYPPGGTADILARDMGARLAASLGQSVVIENRAGAGTAIGARHVAGSAPDGYTLFLGTSTSHVMNPAINAQGVGYDPINDFQPLAAIGEVPYVIVSAPDKGFSSLEGLIARARNAEQPLSYSSAGVGSSNHLAGELLENLTGVSLIHVPYKGSAPALNDVLSGQVDFMFDLLTTSQAHIQSGRLVPLGLAAGQRVPQLPDLPTTAELGHPELSVTAWFGLFAPAGLPPEVAQRLTASLEEVLGHPQTHARLSELGLNVLPLSATAFAEFVRRDFSYWKGIVAQSDVETFLTAAGDRT